MLYKPADAIHANESQLADWMQTLLCCLRLRFGMQMPIWLMRPPTQDRATPAGLSVRPLQSQGMALLGQQKKPTDLEVSLLKAVLLLNPTTGIISLSQRQSLSSQNGRASKLTTEDRSITVAMVMVNLVLVLARLQLLATMQLAQDMLMAVTSQLSISPLQSSTSMYPLLTDLQPNEQGSRSSSNLRLARCVTQKFDFQICDYQHSAAHVCGFSVLYRCNAKEGLHCFSQPAG